MVEPTEYQGNNVEIDARQEALERSVLLLCPHIGWWKGRYQLPGKSTETVSDGRAVDSNDVTTPSAKLMTDTYPVDSTGTAWKKRFQKIESRLTALKEQFSLPFPIQGVRIVPKARGQELMNELYGLTIGGLRKRIQKADRNGYYRVVDDLQSQLAVALRKEGENAPANTPIFDNSRPTESQSIAYVLHQSALEFCNNWDDIRRQIADKNEVFQLVQSKVPTSSGMMRTKFFLDVVPVELASDIGNAHRIGEDELAEHNDIVREACRRRVDEAIETMIEGPRQQLADALSNLQELINRDGRVTPKSFKPVKDAIAKIRMFDFVANEKLLQQMQLLETKLDITQPNSLDSVTAASGGFNAALAGFMAEVQDAQANSKDLEEFGRDLRSLDLD